MFLSLSLTLNINFIKLFNGRDKLVRKKLKYQHRFSSLKSKIFEN